MPYEDFTVDDDVGDGYGEVRDNDDHDNDDAHDHYNDVIMSALSSQIASLTIVYSNV